MRYKFPSEREIASYATPVSRAAFEGVRAHKRLFPREADLAAHVGQGVFMTRCQICGEVFLDAGASTRPAPLVDHLFDVHSVYDDYIKPVFL